MSETEYQRQNDLSVEEQAGIALAAQTFGTADVYAGEQPEPSHVCAPVWMPPLPGNLTEAQYTQLLQPINGMRISAFKRAGKEFSYVEAYELRAHLNRVFGFAAWAADVEAMELLFETYDETSKKWNLAYRCKLRLTIQSSGATYTEWAAGTLQGPMTDRGEAHDFAIKTAESQALKRACMNLGDQFGLSLYNKGSRAPLVKGTVMFKLPADSKTERVDAHITAPLAKEGGDDEPRETSSAKAPSVTDAPEEPGSPMTTLRNLLAQRTSNPTERMGLVREARAFATEHGLLEQATATGGTIGAYLNAEMQKASAAITAAAKGDGS